MTKRNHIIALTGVIAAIAVAIILVPIFTLEARERGDREYPTERPSRGETPTPEPEPTPEPTPEPIIVPQELLERWQAMLEEGLLEEVEEEYLAFIEDGIYPTDEEDPAPQDPSPEETEEQCVEEEGEEEVSDRIRDRVIHRSRDTHTDPVVIDCGEEEEEEPPAEEGEEEEQNDEGGFEATFVEKIAAEIHRLTNIEREKAGLSVLIHDSLLQQIALAHSEDMALNNYFGHINLQNCNLSCRFDEADYDASVWGENIAWRSSTVLPSAEDLAMMFVVSWMNSSGHRDNMLSESFINVGIGIAQVDNRVFATVDFAKPK